MSRQQTRTVRKGTLVASLVIVLAFSLLIGVIGIARGLGSIYPQLNQVAQPLVCRGGELMHKQIRSNANGANYWATTWSCKLSFDLEKEIDPGRVFMYSGAIYGVGLFVILLLVTYLYWNSNIGPAKNDGLRLW